MRILVLGALGFIGSNFIKRISPHVTLIDGVDLFSKDQIVQQKVIKERFDNINKSSNFSYKNIDIAEKKNFLRLYNSDFNYDFVINLAGKPGVRLPILEYPDYIYSNILLHLNLLCLCEKFHSRYIYASSSSVYDNNSGSKSVEKELISKTRSIYATSKFSSELLADNFSKLHSVSSVGLRFFTVYGEFGREDMAYWIFADKVKNQKTLSIFGDGNQSRDFSYVDDITNSIKAIIENDWQGIGHEIFNLGNQNKRTVNELIEIISKHYKKEPRIQFENKDKREVQYTYSDSTKFYKKFNYKFQTSLEEGLNKFLSWYDKFDG